MDMLGYILNLMEKMELIILILKIFKYLILL